MPILSLTPETLVGEIVVAYPFLSRQFEVHGMDYCCGGKASLAQACERKKKSVQDFILELETALRQANIQDGSALPARGLPEADASLTLWIRHILDLHHAYLWDELPALALLVEKVARVHGESDARLVQLSQMFPPFAGDLMQHMQKEERILFPLIEALEKEDVNPQEILAASHCGGIQNPIRQMHAEHDEAGEALSEIRRLTGDFSVPDWACNSYRAMLNRLHHLELDLHMHVHLENNLLFPRALDLQRAFAPG